MDFIKKMAIKKIADGKLPKQSEIPNGKDKAHICRIVGIVRKTTVKETNSGTVNWLVGDFAAKNAKGKEYRGSALTLPNATIQQEIADKLASAKKAVTFAITVDLIKDKGTGVAFLAKPDAADQLMDLTEKHFK